MKVSDGKNIYFMGKLNRWLDKPKIYLIKRCLYALPII